MSAFALRVLWVYCRVLRHHAMVAGREVASTDVFSTKDAGFADELVFTNVD